MTNEDLVEGYANVDLETPPVTHNPGLNVLSLFDGMSCGQIALNRVGIKYDNYFASEIDKHAIKVTQTNYPKTIQLGDVTKVKGSDLPKIDLLIGGSPCQSFSFAGKRKGMSTEQGEEITTLERYLELKGDGFQFSGQSYLFWEYVRILKESSPRYFLLENVKMAKKWEDVISETLGVCPIVINSALVSAQNRKRLYWTNIPGITQPEDRGITLQSVILSGCVDRKKAHCLDANYWKGASWETYLRKSRRQQVMDPTPEKARKLTPVECERLQTVPEGYTEGVSNTQRYKMLGNGWTVDVIAHIFSFMDS